MYGARVNYKYYFLVRKRGGVCFFFNRVKERVRIQFGDLNYFVIIILFMFYQELRKKNSFTIIFPWFNGRLDLI